MKIRIIICLFIVMIACSCTRRSNNFDNNRSTSTNEVKQRPISTEDKHPSIITNGNESNTLSATEIFDRYNSAVFMIFTSDGRNNFQGSGFFVNQYGLAVSNYHVFEGTGIGLESIKLSNGSLYKLKEVIAKSKEYDYIIFQVDILGTCNYIPIANRSCKVGEKVFTIGSPRGLENTFSSGEISQLRGDYVIQINAPIDHGSSGGALINEYGEAVGITSSGYDNSGANLNFAIDINVVKHYLQ